MDQGAENKQGHPAALPAETRTSPQANPIGAGIRLFFVDNGVTISFYTIIGTILLIAGHTVNDIINNNTLNFVGILISLYVAFLLYKNYSKEKKALVALIITSVIFTTADICSQIFTHQPLHLTTQILALATDLVAYIFGWYLAATTNFKMFLLGKKWVMAFFIIGVAAIVFDWIGIMANIYK